jgi:hypothetical protein
MRAQRTALVLAALAILPACARVADDPVGAEGELATVSGVIESIDVSKMAVDGPAVIEVRSQAHGLVTVFVSPCMGPCVPEAVDALGRIEVGQTLWVIGEVGGRDELAVYDHRAHKLLWVEE